MKERNLNTSAARQEGKRIFGMGAPAKGNTLLNYFGIGVETIECLLKGMFCDEGCMRQAPRFQSGLKTKPKNVPTSTMSLPGILREIQPTTSIWSMQALSSISVQAEG